MSENEIKLGELAAVKRLERACMAGGWVAAQIQSDDVQEVLRYIDRLTAELAEANGKLSRFMDRWEGFRKRKNSEFWEMKEERDEAQRKLSVAVAEGKGLVADAERYRFLRNPAEASPQPAAWIEGRGNEFIESEWLTGEFADAAIDAARAEGGV